MERVRYDAIVVGAGPAGVTAAAAIARAGASVLLLEAGAFAGAENWSGCVYFTENLADEEAFGARAVELSPFERKLVRRGLFATDGDTLVGLSHTGADTFAGCLTVLRPAFDPYFADLARRLGAHYLTGVTVTSLIRRGERVVGVHTSQGPAYGDVVFLAEGDASHLVRYEGLERVRAPDFMQGVKAVYALEPEAVDRRFSLAPGEGAANEYLVRNAQLGGRSLHLNLGAFLYTNRASLSVGYVAPLRHLAERYRGRHEDLLNYVAGLPGIAEALEGARLSAFGTKLIRTGGITQSPILVENGLAVGGAATGLGTDFPYPNFTGPASATGLVFARAFRDLSAAGRPFTARNLTTAYLERLRQTRYWKDAQHFADWPGYLEATDVLFGAGVDLACGAARHLTAPVSAWRRWWTFGRFLRDHLALKKVSAVVRDAQRFLSASGLSTAAGCALSARCAMGWLGNTLRRAAKPPAALTVTLQVGGEDRDVARLPLGLRGPVRRRLAALNAAMAAVYRNDRTPVSERLAAAAETLSGTLRLGDMVLVAGVAFGALVAAALSAAVDLLRYKLLRVPAERLLRDAVGRDNERVKRTRDLEGVRGPDMAQRLATNTYSEGARSHIRVLWPEGLMHHGDLASAPYWSVCPAGVYAFEPALSGHGVVTVNHENCIKCESCWQAEPALVRWGRNTDHRLVYRPETAALDVAAPAPDAPPHVPALETVPPLPRDLLAGPRRAPAVAGLARQADRARMALSAFLVAVENVPPAADPTRADWPVRVGEAAVHRLRALGAELLGAEVNALPIVAGMSESPFAVLAEALAGEVERFLHRVRAGDLFEAVGSARRLRDTVLDELDAVLGRAPAAPPALAPRPTPATPGAHEADLRAAFPDRMVKGWDRNGIDADAAADLSARFAALPLPGPDDPVPAATRDALRAWGALHPGVAILALAHVAARGLTGDSGGAALDGTGLAFETVDGGVRVRGVLPLVPARLADHLVLVHRGIAHRVPLTATGVARRVVPAGGLHPCGFETVTFDLTVPAGDVVPAPDWYRSFVAFGYAAVALGAGDYLGRRALEQAEGRVQFPGQMRDPAGRDGVAKFGAVKLLVARTLAWRELLARLVDAPGSGTLAAAVAALAFSPVNGRMAYDAGQTFGGTGYSEDDLMSRFYRDAAVFGFLAPGRDAGRSLAARWRGADSPLPLAARLMGDTADLAALADGPLRPVVQRWQALAARVDRLGMTVIASREALALALGIFHLLSAAHADLEAGRPVEGAAAAIAVLIDEALDLAARGEAEEHQKGPFATAHLPELPEGPVAALDMGYDALTHLDDPYASGDFLKGHEGARVVPELLLHDATLRERWKHCYDWFRTRCARAPDDGGPYERYVERLHAIPPEILSGYARERFLATVVPEELDGLGWRKIDYYLLVSGAMRFGDASLSLLIMASTSIGTTPVLLALDKELPLVAKELGDLVQEPERLEAIRAGLDAIVRQLDRPDPARLERDFTRLVETVESTLRRTKVAKYLAQGFLKTFYEAALAGRRRDFPAFAAGLKAARGRFAELPGALAAALEEVPRRERAARFFLRALGNGAVSAFALTEPGAGSDSGGVTTTARLKSVPLTPLEEGRYRFEVDSNGGDGERFLLDADRVVHIDGGMALRLSDGALGAISTAGYDYSDDTGVRTVQIGGKALPFHDIAQVRQGPGGPEYAFYEVTGAKMWITNGRVATQFAMYVATPEGITGLMVDRHAEGLVVGRDEEKMGQRGSPTNEIAIDRVRVPRECVIGYEGHGQVNALETLNVGRCGLAVAGVVMARRLLVEGLADLPVTEARDRLLAEVAARLFANESLCAHLIGRFDNHATRSVRLESAIAKYACSEMLHESLDRVEALHGPVGQTQDRLLEKMRRDARILNIYEGTNEVQRFLILKELCGLLPDWPTAPAPAGDDLPGRLSAWRERLRRHLAEATDQVGDAVWQDAAMQTAFFPLADMAGEIYLLDCTLYRARWLRERRDALGEAYTDPMLAVAERAAAQCLERLGALEARYLCGREAALNSRYPAAAVASDVAMETTVGAAPEPSGVASDVALACLLRPVAVPAPHPRLGADGMPAERVWRINPGDEHALARALELKAASGARVSVHAVACGGPHGLNCLRAALAAGADGATLLDLPPAAGPHAWAEALADLAPVARADRVLLGAACPDTDAPLGPFLAGRLALKLDEAPDLAAESLQDLDGRGVLTLTSASERLRPTLVGHARTAASPILEAPGAAGVGELRFAPVAATAATRERATDVAAVAALVRAFAAAARGLAAPPWEGDFAAAAPLPRGRRVWTVAEPHDAKSGMAAFAAAARLGAALGVPAHALLIGPEAGVRALAGLARQSGIAAAHAVVVDGPGALSAAGRRMVAEAVGRTPGRTTVPSRVLAPAGWEAALAFAAGACGGPAAVWTGVTDLAAEGESLVLTRPAYGERLRASLRISAESPLWATAGATAAFEAGPTVADFAVTHASLRLADADLDLRFRPPVDDLTTAEVIVDLGLGAGSPEGLALARRLMDALRALGLTPHLGATRKVTQGLGLLGTDHQIGQTGVKVNPRLAFALGISGAPQHVDYLGGRADIIAFNRDPDAPLMHLERPGLTVHPVVGDLFDTVAGLIDALAAAPARA